MSVENQFSNLQISIPITIADMIANPQYKHFIKIDQNKNKLFTYVESNKSELIIETIMIGSDNIIIVHLDKIKSCNFLEIKPFLENYFTKIKNDNIFGNLSHIIFTENNFCRMVPEIFYQIAVSILPKTILHYNGNNLVAYLFFKIETADIEQTISDFSQNKIGWNVNFESNINFLQTFYDQIQMVITNNKLARENNELIEHHIITSYYAKQYQGTQGTVVPCTPTL